MYRIQLIHHVVETDNSISAEALLTAPLTARGLAKVCRRYQDETAYIRRVFGPGTIRPKHSLQGIIVRQDGSAVTHKEPVFDGDRNVVDEYDAPIDIFHPHLPVVNEDRSWTENATELLKYVRQCDEALV